MKPWKDDAPQKSSPTTAPQRRAPVMPDPARQPPSRARSWLRISIVILCLAFLGWQIVRTTIARGLAESNPELALALSPDEPVALLKIVERELQSLIRIWAEAKSATPTQSTTALSEDPPKNRVLMPQLNIYISSLRAMTLRALRVDPTSAKAVRILGQLAEIEGDEAKALEHYRIAARRSKHESVAVFHTARSAFEQKDYKVAIDYGDALLRTRPDLATFVYPMLARIAETEQAMPLLLERLEKSPPWRAQLISGILPAITDARTPLRIMLAMQQRGQTPTQVELRTYLEFLISRQLPEIAYYAWLQLLSPEQLANVRPVNNGKFTETFSGLPFDWTIQTASGAIAEIATGASPEFDRALKIVFDAGRSDLGNISQTLLLSQGAYVFNVKAKGELIGRRGLKWELTCGEPSTQRLGETGMFIGKHPTWQDVGFTFVVPAENCRSQKLRLVLDARSASEQMITGAVLFTDVGIARN